MSEKYIKLSDVEMLLENTLTYVSPVSTSTGVILSMQRILPTLPTNEVGYTHEVAEENSLEKLLEEMPSLGIVKMGGKYYSQILPELSVEDTELWQGGAEIGKTPLEALTKLKDKLTPKK